MYIPTGSLLNNLVIEKVELGKIFNHLGFSIFPNSTSESIVYINFSHIKIRWYRFFLLLIIEI